MKRNNGLFKIFIITLNSHKRPPNNTIKYFASFVYFFDYVPKSTPIFYGEYKNVRPSKEEYKNLKEKLNSHTEIMINKLSRYMKSSGKTYQNHYATILNWYEEDKEKLRHQDSDLPPI